jgi:hypothetical protein
MEEKFLTTQNDFSRYGKHLSGILGFRGKPEDTLEFTKDQNIFMKQPNESVKQKIHNHRNNVIELKFKKKQERT